MLRVLLAHPGTQYAPMLARQLERLGLLGAFWTGDARRRGGLGRGRLRAMPWLHVATWLARRMGLDYQRAMHWRNAVFQRLVPADVLRTADVVIGFDTSSWILARRCRALRRPFVLDQSIGHPMHRERVFAEVAARYPEWSETWRTRRPEVLAAENLEHALADRIVAASAFTRRTLADQGVDPGRIRINPYGVDLEEFACAERGAPRRPIRFVFAGSVQARKGVPVLLEAWRRLAAADAELWLAGPVASQARRLIPSLTSLCVKGPVPHSRIPALLASADVFVFPSLFEGFGLVILEAMACGLPVITTEATAGPDLIEDGREGFLVPAGDPDALGAKMAWCLAHRGQLPAMGRAARLKASQFTWEAYGERWKRILEEVIGEFGIRKSKSGA